MKKLWSNELIQTEPERRLASLDPRCLGEMLDYRLYLTYRDCGYFTERLLRTEFGINRRRWRIIAIVHQFEGATLSDIAEGAELDKAQASRTVGTMVREGYLKRLSNPDNARFAKIIFTDKGRELYDAILARYREANQSLVASLSYDEIAMLDGVLEKLRQHAARLMAPH